MFSETDDYVANFSGNQLKMSFFVDNFDTDSTDESSLEEFFVPDFLDDIDDLAPPMPVTQQVKSNKRAAPGHAMSKKELEEALKDQHITKNDARKLRNRMSAMASRQRTHSQVGYLTELTESLQRELKCALLSLEKYEPLEAGTKRKLDDLTQASLVPQEPKRKAQRAK